MEKQQGHIYMEQSLRISDDIVCFETMQERKPLVFPGNSNLFLWDLENGALQHYAYPQYGKELVLAGERLFGIRFRGNFAVTYREETAGEGRFFLEGTQDFEERVRYLQQHFKRMFHLKGCHPLIKYIMEETERTKGILSMESAAESYGYSLRQAERLFKQHFGYGPKRYCQYERLLRVISYMQENPDRTWDRLAKSAGYADVSHFQREFRQYMGVSPKQFRKEYLGNFLR